MLPQFPANRASLISTAKHLLGGLLSLYQELARTLHGERTWSLPLGIAATHFRDWDDQLGRATDKVLSPPAMRAIVEEAIVEAQTWALPRLERDVGRARATELLRDFAAAVDRQEFARPQNRSFGEWLGLALRLPSVPPSADTPGNAELRERVAALSEAERRCLAELTLSGEATTLTNLSPLVSLTGLRTLSILGAPLLSDLTPLAHMPWLEDLTLSSATAVTDISPVAEISGLRRLTLGITRIRDASCLAKLRGLESLDLGGETSIDGDALASLTSLRTLDLGEAVRDLSPLARLPALEELGVSLRHVDDPSPLSLLTTLRTLGIGMHSRLPSLDVLRPLCGLRKLTILHTDIQDAAGLGDLTELEELDLSMSAVRDFGVLARLTKLKKLDVSLCVLRDLGFARTLGALQELNAMGSELTTLAGIEGARRLRKVNVDSTGVRDLGPLAGLVELEELDLGGMDQLEDLSPLRGLAKLRHLEVGDTAVADLSPIAGLTAIENLNIARTPRLSDLAPLANLRNLRDLNAESTAAESLAPLAGLPQLASIELSYAGALPDLYPLAECPNLRTLHCEECARLRGPRTLTDLRHWKDSKTARPTFPSASAGAPEAGAGEDAVYDARNHVPKRPPEDWTVPRHLAKAESYVIEVGGKKRAGSGTRVIAYLEERDEAGKEFALFVHIAAPDREPPGDKQVARILRRFRACGPFVETEEAIIEDASWVRTFAAKAAPASPSTWGPVTEERTPLAVAAPPGEQAPPPPSAVFDVDNHVPSPLPEGWTVRPGKTEDSRRIVTPEVMIGITLSRAQASDVFYVGVGLFPLRKGQHIGDELAQAVLEQIRARGAFEESVQEYAAAPGARVFKAVARARGGVGER